MAVHRTRSGYQIWYYDADGRFRKRTLKGITRDDALRLERELLARRDRGDEIPDRRRTPTFSAFAEQWKGEGRARWKPATIAQYQNVLKKQLLPAFGERRLGTITEAAIQERMAAWHDAGLAARRINLILMVLKSILKTAVRRRLIASDPAASVRFLPEPRSEVDPLDPGEVTAFLNACPTFWRPYFTVAFWTGARPNELAALKWGDIDWKRRSFRIRAGRARGIEGTPKTPGSVRDVDTAPAVIEALRARLARQSAQRLRRGEGTPESGKDYVFTGPGGGLLNVNFLREYIWYPTLTKAELRRRTFYNTRHTFASNALASGEAPPWISAMLGHKTSEMLFEVYARYIPNRTRRDGSAFAAQMAPNAARRAPVLLPFANQQVGNSEREAGIGKSGAEGGT